MEAIDPKGAFGRALLLCVIFPVAACLDLKPAAPPPTRWLSIPAPDTAERGSSQSELRVHLRSVQSSPAIDDRLIRRGSPYEISYAPTVRWIEPPGDSLLRAVEGELFGARGMTAVSRDVDHVMDLELLHFEELTAPVHAAKVAVRLRLVDESSGAVLLDRIIAAQSPVRADGDAADVAEAMTGALRDVAADIADRLGPGR